MRDAQKEEEGEGDPRGITGSDGDPTVNRGNHGNLATWQIELESSPLSRPWSDSFVSAVAAAVSN